METHLWLDSLLRNYPLGFLADIPQKKQIRLCVTLRLPKEDMKLSSVMDDALIKKKKKE